MVERVEKEFGPLDVLVNSAGAAKRTNADELTPAAWRAGMDAKYFTYINVIDPVVKRMAARGQGAIINVIGSGGKIASADPPCRRRGQRRADAGHRGAGLRLCEQGRARGGRQPRASPRPSASPRD